MYVRKAILYIVLTSGRRRKRRRMTDLSVVDGLERGEVDVERDLESDSNRKC